MSYARFGWGGSDVYVYEDTSGHLVCCACRLNGPVELDETKMLGVSFPDNWTTEAHGPPYSPGEPDRRLPSRAYGEMMAHLSEHENAEHIVPDKAFARLQREMSEAIEYERRQ